jgi:hypothetical protein
VKNGADPKQMKLKGMAVNSQKFRTLSYKTFQFVDSLSFLDASLDKVVKDLESGGHEFPLLQECGVVDSGDKLELIKRKGELPYYI